MNVRAYDLRLATESAARAAFDGIDHGTASLDDRSAVLAMSQALTVLEIKARILMGEGSHEDATGPCPWDAVLDPAEGTSILTPGMTNAMACIALVPSGTLFDPSPVFYMEKLVVPPAAKGKVDPASPIEKRLSDLGLALNKNIADLVIYVLEKPRHRDLVDRIQKAGARVALYPAGDVAGSLMAAIPESGIDALMGTGGCPEGMLSAVAIKLMGGDFFARLAPQLATEKKKVAEARIDTTKWWDLDQLVRTDQALFCATGITSGLLLDGIIRNESLDKVQTLLLGGEASPRQLLTSWYHRG
jgi:fructose-1,6-bisphosphatase II